MATHADHDTKRNGRWTPSSDVRISEKRGISLARDSRTGRLKSRDTGTNGRSPRDHKPS